MAKKWFSYDDEKAGLVAEYLAANPVHHVQYSRPDYPDGVLVLTGDDTPAEPVPDAPV